MIAVISSTIEPSQTPSHDGARTNLTVDVRFKQTIDTVRSLESCGIQDIVLLDNSHKDFGNELRLNGFSGRFVHCPQPDFRNKGIGEIWMLQSLPHELPDLPVLKLSARYSIRSDSALLQPPASGIRARTYGHGANRTLSTRAYTVSSLTLARTLWERTLHELFSIPTQIIGPRSFIREIKRQLIRKLDVYPYGDPPIALELAIHRAAMLLEIPIAHTQEIGISGVLGSWINPSVTE